MTELNNVPFRSGYVTITGRPNVGKSTLMNAYLQMKLAIVTNKPQTTRHRILGILQGDNYQMIFQDTPGLITPKYLLQETMIKTAHLALQDADVILMQTDPVPDLSLDDPVVEAIRSSKAPKLLAINKIDAIEKSALLPMIDHYGKLECFDEIFPVSALKHQGLDELLEGLLKRLPEGEPFYPPDLVTSEPERFFVAELIREQIFFRYSKEVPYASTVQIEQFTERPGRKDYIEAVITMERESQKGILIGKQGQSLKQLGEAARKEIESFLGRPVYLKLVVRVRDNWRRNPGQLKNFGYQ